MRVLVMARPQFPIPQEQFPMLIQGFADWRERYGKHMEAFEFFAGGNGGFGILNVSDEAMLNRIMLEWPFSMFSHLEVTPIIRGDEALRQWMEMAQQMGGR